MKARNISDMNKEKEEDNTNQRINEKVYNSKNKKKSSDIPNLLINLN